MTEGLQRKEVNFLWLFAQQSFGICSKNLSLARRAKNPKKSAGQHNRFDLANLGKSNSTNLPVSSTDGETPSNFCHNIYLSSKLTIKKIMETLSQTSCKHCGSTEHTTENHEQADGIAAVWATYLDISNSDEPEDQEFAEEMIDDLN
ncbi:MAG: hypothetical protein ACOZAK_02715 [Patescibacteria group bacterium]